MMSNFVTIFSFYITLITSMVLTIAIFYFIFNFIMDCFYKVGKDYVKNPYYFFYVNFSIYFFLFIYVFFVFMALVLHFNLIINLWLDYYSFILPTESEFLLEKDLLELDFKFNYAVMDPNLTEVLLNPKSKAQIDFVDQVNILYGIPNYDYNWDIFYNNVMNNFIRNLSLYLDYQMEPILRSSVNFGLEFNVDQFYWKKVEDFIIPEKKENFFPPEAPARIKDFIYRGTAHWVYADKNFLEWWLTSVEQNSKEMDYFYNGGFARNPQPVEELIKDPFFAHYLDFCSASKEGAISQRPPCSTCKPCSTC